MFVDYISRLFRYLGLLVVVDVCLLDNEDFFELQVGFQG